MWLLLLPLIDAALAQDTGTQDDDGDGLSPSEGDCDDADPAVPGDVEVCFDDVDNDCNGFVDELCDDSAHLGSLSGGGACTGGGGIAAAPLLLPLALIAARRRSAR